MEDRYIGLRIYNNFNWVVTLHKLENNNYTWASGDKPTSLYYDYTQGIIFIDPNTKTLTKASKTTALSRFCNYYIEVR